MKRLIVVTISALLLVGILSRCGAAKKTSSSEEISQTESPLVSFGKEIFKRESCNSCHTLSIESANSRLVSLDGLGGKYTSSWLHYYLYDPQSVIPESEKEGRKHLFGSSLQLDQISRPHPSKEKSSKWERLLSEADSLSKELQDDGVAAYRTEILALISYLQEIPASRRRIKLDSLQYVEYQNEQKLWENLVLDTSSVIIETAKNPSMTESGALVFHTNCAVCHGANGQGLVGPNLTDDYWIHGSSTTDIARTVINGAKNGMVPWKGRLTPTEVGQVVSFIRSIRGTDPPNAKTPQGKKE